MSVERLFRICGCMFRDGIDGSYSCSISRLLIAIVAGPIWKTHHGTQSSSLSLSSSVIAALDVPDDSYSAWGMIESQCCFNLIYISLVAKNAVHSQPFLAIYIYSLYNFFNSLGID